MELEKGHIAGPVAISPTPHLHVSYFEVIPKKTPTWQMGSNIGPVQSHWP